MASTLKVQTALSATPQSVEDESGNRSSLALSTNNVGIGTTAPQGVLDVNGNVVLNGNAKTQLSASGDTTNVKGGLIVLDLSPVGGGQLHIGSNTDDDKIFLEGFNRDGSASALEMLITGRFAKSLPQFTVLANLTRLLGVVQIGENFNASFILSPSNRSPNAGFIRFGDNTGWKLHFARARNESGGPVVSPDTAILMTIQDNGNVGIGTSRPQEKLVVDGNIVANDVIVQGVSFQALLQRVQELEKKVGGGVSPAGRRISVSKEGAGQTTIFVVTGTGFTPDSLVIIRITDSQLRQIQFPETAGADGKFVSRHSVPCTSGLEFTFTAFEDSNPTGTIANPVVTTCP